MKDHETPESRQKASASHAAITAYPEFVRQRAAKIAAAHAPVLVHVDLKPQLARTVSQDRFHLRIALKAFRHARHFLARTLPPRHVAGTIEAVAVLGELLPAFHEPIGAHPASCAIAATIGPLRDTLALIWSSVCVVRSSATFPFQRCDRRHREPQISPRLCVRAPAQMSPDRRAQVKRNGYASLTYAPLTHN
nr:hypothetical protein [Sphingobium sp. B2]